jgi:hypothetical protein
MNRFSFVRTIGRGGFAAAMWITLCACVVAIASPSFVRADDATSDALELSSGLIIHGKWTDGSVKINSRLSQIEVPLADVRSLICERPPRVSQVLATDSGDLLVGRVAGDSIHFTGNDGKAIELPLIHIRKITRAATSPPTTMPAGAVVVEGMDGDQIAVDALGPIEFRTRWGVISFTPEQIAQVVLHADEQSAHKILLADGSSLSGFVTNDSLELHPQHLAIKTIKVLAGELTKIDFTAAPGFSADGPKIDMLGGDVLRGTLAGKLTLQTELGASPIPADDIVSIAPVADSGGDLMVTLGDGHTVTGTPGDAPVQCKLGCGATVSIPVEMIVGYTKSAAGFVRLSATPNLSQGLTALSGGDGVFSIEQNGSASCWRVTNQPNGHYLYFALDSSLHPWSHGVVEIEVEYLDSGTSDVSLDYDSADGSVANPYKRHIDVIHRKDSGQWRVASFRISDAHFSGGQNLGADFRLNCGSDDLLVRAVTIQRPEEQQ